jgi:CRISPR/Cas system CSM-associated protein Csm3 (group 7 of RAMP superfamily)
MQEGLTMGDTVKYTHRYLARIIIEAETPLAVGSGERDVTTDRLVATDVNGLPYIPGTALAGVLRNAFSSTVDKTTLLYLFGYAEQDVKEENKGKKEQDKDKGRGSRLIISSAQMVGKDGKVIDGLQIIEFSDKFYTHFQNLPIRQHVRMSHKGAAEQGGKFDEQVVYKGTRFCFEIELVGNKVDEKVWGKLIEEFSNPAFRIGGGTRKGFGAIKVEDVKGEVLKLTDEKDLNRYLEKTSNLKDSFWDNIQSTQSFQSPQSAEWIKYELILTPDDFFLFGSGFGNEDGSADMSYVTEKVIDWSSGKGIFTDEKVLIPATSVKGALAHRTAFHFNKICGVFADNLKETSSINELCQKGYCDFRNQPGDAFDSKKYEDRLKLVTTYNPAVRNLFGFALDDKNNGSQRGNVLFSDIFLSDKNKSKQKLLNHVAIDRFTGGAIDGALFSEEVAASKEKFILKIFVKDEKKETFSNYLKAFECALNDLCTGMLPLGGGTMRGHGCFTGELIKNGK